MPGLNQSRKIDDLRELLIKSFLIFFGFLIVSIVIFQAFGSLLIVDKWVTVPLTGALTTIIAFFFRRKKIHEIESDLVSLRDKSLMYIEDDPTHQTLFRWYMRRFDIDCMITYMSSAEEAYTELTRRNFAIKPDLIIVDLNLGADKMTGEEFIRKIKSDPDLFDIPIVILSGNPKIESKDQTALEYCRFYIDRSQGMEALRDAIKSVFDPQSENCEEVAAENKELKKQVHDLRNMVSQMVTAHELGLPKAQVDMILGNIAKRLKETDATLRNILPALPNPDKKDK